MQTTSPIDLEFDPIDWQQMELLAQLSAGAAHVDNGRGCRVRARRPPGDFPSPLSGSFGPEINMKVLAYLTPVRGIEL